MHITTMLFAPDGMNAGHHPQETRQSTDRPNGRPADRRDDDHDDGLVHEHRWARTSPER
jgi:hypothetical protein